MCSQVIGAIFPTEAVSGNPPQKFLLLASNGKC